MVLSFRRRQRGDFTMDDLASHGALIGAGTSDEPRLPVDDAARWLASSTTVEQTESVLQFVRPRDRKRVIALAHERRDRADQTALRAQWADQALPFEEGS